MTNIKLGQKVKCFAKLAKIKPIAYVYRTEEEFEKAKKEGSLPEKYYNLEEEDDYVCVETKEIVRTKPFVGVVVGKIQVSTTNIWEMFDDYYTQYPFCYKEGYIECYRVYYALNHSRLVPVGYAEEIK